MRSLVGMSLAAVCLAQAQTGDLTLKIPPVKTSLNLEGQSVELTAWGAGRLWLAITGEARLSAEQFRDVAKRLAH